jgi:hypothetical protein
MNAAELLCTILGTVVTVLVALASLVWWAYKRGIAAGKERAEDKAKIEGLERQLAETRAELAAMQPKRRLPQRACRSRAARLPAGSA